MTFVEKMKQFWEKSVDTSKEALAKAGAQAQVWGEQGKLKFEILQLRASMEKLSGKLGTEVYELLVNKGEPMVGAYTTGIAATIADLKKVKADIDEKEAAFRAAGGKDADLDGDGQPG